MLRVVDIDTEYEDRKWTRSVRKKGKREKSTEV